MRIHSLFPGVKVVLTLATLAASGGCGGGTDGGGTPASGPSADDAGAGADAPLNSSEASVMVADVVTDVAPAVTTNGLLLTSTVMSGGGDLAFDNVIARTGGACAVARQDVCFVQDCRKSAGTLSGATAGEVDLKRGGSAVLKTSPAATGLYPVEVMQTAPWAAGESVHFAASGAEVPAFDIALTAPPAISVLTVLPGPHTTVTFHTSMDLIFGWQKGPGEVAVELVQSNTAGDLASTLRVLCEWVGDPGAGKVPASIMGLFATDASLHNTVRIGGSSRLDLTLNGYWVHIALMNAQGGAFTLMP